LRDDILKKLGEKIFELDPKVSAIIEKITSDAMSLNTENAKQLDNHLIYIAAGALFVVSEFAQSNNAHPLIINQLLASSFCFFAFCVSSVIMSFIFMSQYIHRKDSGAQHAKLFSTAIMELAYETTKHEMTKELDEYAAGSLSKIPDPSVAEKFRHADLQWKLATKEIKRINTFAFFVEIANLTAYFSFFIALILISAVVVMRLCWWT